MSFSDNLVSNGPQSIFTWGCKNERQFLCILKSWSVVTYISRTENNNEEIYDIWKEFEKLINKYIRDMALPYHHLNFSGVKQGFEKQLSLWCMDVILTQPSQKIS